MAGANEPGPARLAARELVEQFPDAPARQLARMLHEKRPKLFPSVESARQAVRIEFGQAGNDKRDKSRPDNFREARTQQPCQQPPSLSKTWDPFVIPAKYKRLLVLSDVHVPYHATEPIERAIEHGLEQGCDAVLLNGDIVDFYSISRFDKNPEQRDLQREVETAGEWLDWLKAKTGCKVFYKAGNHDERWDHFIWNRAPELWGLTKMRLPAMLELAERGVEYIGDQRPVLFSGLPILHGHEMGKGGVAAPVNPARGVFLRATHTLMVGHGHRTSQHAESDLWHKETVCWSTGCLCALTPEYARVNKWNWGFAQVNRRSRDRFHVHNLRISSDGDVRT